MSENDHLPRAKTGVVDKAATGKRRHLAGETTRILLMETAERMFAERGIDAVTSRDIQLAAGQSNSSVIKYHFGSKEGLVRALVEYRQGTLDVERAAMIRELAESGSLEPRSVVWVVAGPMANSVRRGEGYVAFLSRLFENPDARSKYWPEHYDSSWGQADVEALVGKALVDSPPRIRRARAFQLFNSVISLLGEHCRNRRGISDAQLHNYVDGWVGLLAAPVSERTAALLRANPVKELR